MYCKKCGSLNDDDAVYCKKCGTLLEAEDETRVVRRAADSVNSPAVDRSRTMDRSAAFDVNASDGNGGRAFVTGPTLKFVKVGYGLAIFAAIFVYGLSQSFIVSIVVGMVLLAVAAYFHLQRRLIRYSLRDDCIEVDSGLISRTTRNIPLSRIQDVTVTSGVWQRLLNFGDVVIDNASEDGGKVVIRNIDSPREYADRLLSHMRRLER